MAPGASGSAPDATRLGLKVPASFFSSVGLRFRPRCIAAKYVPCEEIANYARAKNRLAGPVFAPPPKRFWPPPRWRGPGPGLAQRWSAVRAAETAVGAVGLGVVAGGDRPYPLPARPPRPC